MSAQPLQAPRFVRKTVLAPGEYRKNFHQIDRDIIAALTSPEADRVTPLMGKVYLRLISAPAEFWEREGVLYFAPRATEDQPVKSSKVLYEVLGVASATAHKALRWLHEQGIIGYFAGKNGAGIRVFLNRAASSIGVREGTAGKKILPFAPGSNDARRGSTVEPAFNDSFADPEVLDTDRNPHAPENGAAGQRTSAGETAPEPDNSPLNLSPFFTRPGSHDRRSQGGANQIDGDALVERLAREIAPHVRAAAAREHERTREWFAAHALPKAIRVSQRAAYDVLRAHGVVTEPRGGKRNPGLEVGRHAPAPPRAETLTDEDVTMLAQSCVALFETQGQEIGRTLAEMGVEGGGFLLSEDAPRVRARAEALLRGAGEPSGGGEETRE
ncbi:MAG TPA: hypothetical protein VM864_16565 [Pyrinomonadaceae bacterium]|jgi:hypothetical protein|nr:hypothetical protein [Pyrinomonadaceae bacterium]